MIKGDVERCFAQAAGFAAAHSATKPADTGGGLSKGVLWWLRLEPALNDPHLHDRPESSDGDDNNGDSDHQKQAFTARPNKQVTAGH